MNVVLLADVPQHLPQVAMWLFEEWWSKRPDSSQEAVVARLRQCLNQARIDMTFVCLEGEVPIGTVSLVRSDMENGRNLTPWLAALYVSPPFRKQGAATMLMQAVLDQAVRLGFPEVYLFTAHAQEFYLRLGWEEFAREWHQGKEVLIFRKETALLASDG